jgi:putative ABC transport system substrate-binding protein
LSRVGILSNPGNPISSSILASARTAALAANIVLVAVEARNPQEIDDAFSKLLEERVGAIVLAPDAFFNSRRQQIAELAISRQLPSVFAQREYVADGGLMSYGESLADFYKRSASYVDKIIKGARPADLPVEQPTHFYLVVNLKTAKAIGLTIPESFLLRADEVIE